MQNPSEIRHLVQINAERKSRVKLMNFLYMASPEEMKLKSKKQFLLYRYT